MIEVRTMKLSGLRDREEYLSREAGSLRREKASRFIREDDRLRCLAVGYMMRRCLPGYSEALLCTGKAGKPFLRDGVPFSISHGGNYIVLAWCAGAEGIGVDAEPIREMEYYQAILPYSMTAKERDAVGGDAGTAVRIWTRKESLYKCVGEGVSDFRELPEVLEDRVLFSGRLCRLKSWEEEDHAFSVALHGSEESMDLMIQPVAL